MMEALETAFASSISMIARFNECDMPKSSACKMRRISPAGAAATDKATAIQRAR
jgi:hypothetical protein